MTLSTRDLLPIGELAARSGIAASALRYYEDLGLIHAERTSGGQRRYRRSTLRRLAFIRAAQRIGLSLDEVGESLGRLPVDHVPNAAEWKGVATSWQRRIDQQIEELERLKAKLTGCVGCGCLSLTRCGLYNLDDAAGAAGPGARYLLGDRAPAPPRSQDPPPRPPTY
ncbi:MerR family transcriptional regulator, redox-sensitive transcriptional activator SoxR [Actinacidiphila alni]|uniref:MerR family transcriptional regulator, redox-sensitive transcriptional activator SoxR n=1 Tax=Actinacidiphila alni TaxID=380248 RepID=A0A1I1XCM1_9ACTN|nr:redox-sensitive transcriptional activator SoxR [Actinacidiphila alni]SFE05176.1 MerR family transcriptional regulator, redox-sensitive transcriptional activator SoxR [Actinacidiphila alni]